MSQDVKILLVDDETAILETLSILFRGAGYEVSVADSGAKALTALSEEKPDIVLTDIRMPGATGLEVLAKAREVDAEISVILMTAQASLQSAVRAVNEGAYYYLQKPFANDELLAICQRAAEARQLRVENRALKKEIKKRNTSAELRPVGTAPCFAEVLELAETVAPTDSTVLLSGESGTGKEVVARYIHRLSKRAEGPFLLEMRVTTDSPSATRPQMVCWPSSAGCATTQMRNCVPPLFGSPGATTAETVPGVCRSPLASASRSPNPPRPYSSPRVGSFVIGSPPWMMPRATIR